MFWKNEVYDLIPKKFHAHNVCKKEKKEKTFKAKEAIQAKIVPENRF